MSNKKFEICLALGIVAAWLVFEYPATVLGEILPDSVPPELFASLTDEHNSRRLGTFRILGLMACLFLGWRFVLGFSQFMFGQKQ